VSLPFLRLQGNTVVAPYFSPSSFPYAALSLVGLISFIRIRIIVIASIRPLVNENSVFFDLKPQPSTTMHQELEEYPSDHQAFEGIIRLVVPSNLQVQMVSHNKPTRSRCLHMQANRATITACIRPHHRPLHLAHNPRQAQAASEVVPALRA
jgi:hypothetical protein